MNIEQFERMRTGQGFIAALDQSGGSTPKALRLYGVAENEYSNETQMFDLVHKMRSRIITSPVFSSERILAVILFEMTMKRTIDGLPSAEYLWHRKGIVPFLKIDDGLREEFNGALLMKPIHELEERLQEATKNGIFGTKMRSVIKMAVAIRELTGGHGADVVLDFVGAEATLKMALAAARTLGDVTLVGLAGGTVPFSFFSQGYEVRLQTTYWGSKPELIEVLHLAGRGLIRAEHTRYSLDDSAEAYLDLVAGTVRGRAVIVP